MKRSINIDALTRPTIQAMQAYRSARSEFVASDREMILLDANENPFETRLNRYPDPMQTELKERLGQGQGCCSRLIYSWVMEVMNSSTS